MFQQGSSGMPLFGVELHHGSQAAEKVGRCFIEFRLPVDRSLLALEHLDVFQRVLALHEVECVALQLAEGV